LKFIKKKKEKKQTVSFSFQVGKRRIEANCAFPFPNRTTNYFPERFFIRFDREQLHFSLSRVTVAAEIDWQGEASCGKLA
jgi:hypothetical protein